MTDQDKVLPDAQEKACKAARNFACQFGEVVKQHRTSLHLTQKELTLTLHKCGIKVTQTYISRLEAGQRKNPSTQLVIALASILSISLDRIISIAQGLENTNR